MGWGDLVQLGGDVRPVCETFERSRGKEVGPIYQLEQLFCGHFLRTWSLPPQIVYLCQLALFVDITGRGNVLTAFSLLSRSWRCCLVGGMEHPAASRPASPDSHLRPTAKHPDN